MTSEELQDIALQVRDYLLADSQGVGEVPVTESLAGINSLPALRSVDGAESVVSVPISSLASKMRVTLTHIQYFEPTTNVWENIIPLSDIQGKSAYDVAKKINPDVGTEAEWLKTLIGKTAYEIAVANGYKGTENEWLKTLIGKSAYEVALSYDPNIGTIEQWIASLKGKSAYELAYTINPNIGSIEQWIASLSKASEDSAKKANDAVASLAELVNISISSIDSKINIKSATIKSDLSDFVIKEVAGKIAKPLVVSGDEVPCGTFNLFGETHTIYEKTFILNDLLTQVGIKGYTLADEPLGYNLYMSLDGFTVSTGKKNILSDFYNNSYVVSKIYVDEEMRTVAVIGCNSNVDAVGLSATLHLRYIKFFGDHVEFNVTVPEGVDPTGVELSFPALKYNKKMVESWTNDDSYAIYNTLFSLINKKRIRTDYEYAHMGDNLDDPSVTLMHPTEFIEYSDGCGVKHRFASSVGSFPNSPNYMQNQWNEWPLFMDFGHSICYHDLIGYDGSSQQNYDSAMAATKTFFNDNLGYYPKILLEPNGDHRYLVFGKMNSVIQMQIAQSGDNITPVYPAAIGFTLDKNVQTVQRMFTLTGIGQDLNACHNNRKSNNKSWLIHGTHRQALSPSLLFFNTVNKCYGLKGDDSVWFPSVDEMFEWWFIKNGTVAVKRVDGKVARFKLYVPTANCFTFRSLSVMLSGIYNASTTEVCKLKIYSKPTKDGTAKITVFGNSVDVAYYATDTTVSIADRIRGLNIAGCIISGITGTDEVIFTASAPGTHENPSFVDNAGKNEICKLTINSGPTVNGDIWICLDNEQTKSSMYNTWVAAGDTPAAVASSRIVTNPKFSGEWDMAALNNTVTFTNRFKGKKAIPFFSDSTKYNKQSLKITAGSTAEGKINVCLNATDKFISIPSGKSIADIVSLIASTKFEYWTVTANGDTVDFVCTVNVAISTSILDAGTTGITGTWAETKTGVTGTSGSFEVIQKGEDASGISGYFTRTINGLTIDSNCSGMSFGVDRDSSNILINLDFNPGLVEKAEKYVAKFEKSLNVYDYEDAQYFIQHLKESLRTPFKNRLDALFNPPSLNLILINSGALTTNSLSVSIAPTYTGNVTHYMISENPAFTSAEWNSYSGGNISFMLSDSIGNKTVYVKMKNSIGESSVQYDSIEFTVATLELSGVSINSGASDTNSLNVAITYSEAGSPATHYMISESSTFTGAEWKTITSSIPFTLSAGNGTKTVYLKLKNKYNETSVLSDTITYTAVPFSLTSVLINSGDANTYNNVVNVEITGTGNIPTQYCISENVNMSGAEWKAYTGTIQFTLSSGYGVKNIYVQTTDGVDNSAILSDSITLIEQVSLSSISINSGAASTGSQNVSIAFTYTGLPTHYMLSEDAAFSGASWVAFTSPATFALSAGYGIKKIYAKIKDANNTSSVVNATIEYKLTSVGRTAIIACPLTSSGAVESNPLDGVYWNKTTEVTKQGPYGITSANIVDTTGVNWMKAIGRIEYDTDGIISQFLTSGYVLPDKAVGLSYDNMYTYVAGLTDKNPKYNSSLFNTTVRDFSTGRGVLGTRAIILNNVPAGKYTVKIYLANSNADRYKSLIKYFVNGSTLKSFGSSILPTPLTSPLVFENIEPFKNSLLIGCYLDDTGTTSTLTAAYSTIEIICTE